MLKQSLEFSITELNLTLESKIRNIIGVRNIINVRIFKNLEKISTYFQKQKKKRMFTTYLLRFIIGMSSMQNIRK